MRYWFIRAATDYGPFNFYCQSSRAGGMADLLRAVKHALVARGVSPARERGRGAWFEAEQISRREALRGY